MKLCTNSLDRTFNPDSTLTSLLGTDNEIKGLIIMTLFLC